jgi:formylglycine-generating enzyme required for sulfatase activity
MRSSWKLGEERMVRVLGLFAFLCLFVVSHPNAVAQPEQFINNIGMEFVLIAPGSFNMGSPPDEPFRNTDETPHKVTLSEAFYIQVTEVTQRQWKAVMRSNPSYFKRCGENCPVDRVSWLDCQKFIRKLNELGEGRYRLPSEAEWEYACRSGTTTAYVWGDDLDCSRAMFENNTRRDAGRCVEHIKDRGLKEDSTAPVRSYDASPWGVFDMHGNVWEWCQDWYEEDYPEGEVVDPKGPESGTKRVRRGGSWFKHGTYLRSANRNYAHSASRYRTTGFRLVREVQ